MVRPNPYMLGADDAEPIDGFPEIPKREQPNDSHTVEIMLRIDADVLAAFKARGPGWQTRMHEALRRAVRPG